MPVAVGSCDAVFYDNLADKPVPIPDEVRSAVESLEGRAF